MRGLSSVLSGLLLLAPLLGGCAEAPFITESHPSAPAPSEGQIVSVCYNANVTTREEIRALAQKECKDEDTKAEFWHHDRMLNDCPVLAKMRVSYLCVPTAK